MSSSLIRHKTPQNFQMQELRVGGPDREAVGQTVGEEGGGGLRPDEDGLRKLEGSPQGRRTQFAGCSGHASGFKSTYLLKTNLIEFNQIFCWCQLQLIFYI